MAILDGDLARISIVEEVVHTVTQVHLGLSLRDLMVLHINHSSLPSVLCRSQPSERLPCNQPNYHLSPQLISCLTLPMPQEYGKSTYIGPCTASVEFGTLEDGGSTFGSASVIVSMFCPSCTTIPDHLYSR
jgi:hypothetical protein